MSASVSPFSFTPLSTNFSLTTTTTQSLSTSSIFGNSSEWRGLGNGSYTKGPTTLTLPSAANGYTGSVSVNQGSGSLTLTRDANNEFTLKTDFKASTTSSGKVDVKAARADLDRSLDSWNRWAESFLEDVVSGNKKRKGGSSSAHGAGGGGSSSVNGHDPSADGDNLLDPDSWDSGGESWFVQMASAMGEIIRRKAVAIKEILDKIDASGDDPPQGLTMKFQGLVQEMQFIQSAFSTALNALGETIKKALEQSR